MKKGIKIVAIGGGSSYTPDLVEGLINHYDDFPTKELWLVDIQEGKEKLEIIGSFAKRMIKKANLPIKLYLTLDRSEALKGADFVISQFRVGQLDARVLDERIPGNHRMLGQETTGAAGLFKALRTVPIIFEIIKDMRKFCDNAWLINFTNPTGIISEAVFRHCDFSKYIGVCNVPKNMTSDFAQILDAKPKDLIPYFGGLNHLSYVFNVYYRHKENIREIISKMQDDQSKTARILKIPGNQDFIEQLGVIPNPYLKYYYNYQEMYEAYYEQFKNNNTRAEQVKNVDKVLFEKYKDESCDTIPEELNQRGGAKYSDVACDIINSIYNDKKEYHVVNTINNGYITDLPEGCAIEITSRITQHGPIPVFIGTLPETIKGLLQSMKNYEQLLVDAIYEKDLKKAKLALQIHPLTLSIDNADKCFDELLNAHKHYIRKYYEVNHEIKLL